MPVKDKFSILIPLAKELGYKDAREMRDALGKEQAGRGGEKQLGFGNIGGPGGVGTGFLGGREIGAGFGVGVKKRLAKGMSVGEAVSGGLKDFTQTFALQNIKRRSLEKAFGGPGLISAFARGKLKKKYDTESKAPSRIGTDGQEIETSSQASSYLGILAKASIVLPGMARDTNVLRQNLQKLVKIWGGKAATKGEVERAKDISYFAEQDKREAELEAANQKTGPMPVSPTPEKKDEEGGGLLNSIFSFITNGLLKAFQTIFNPKALLKVLGKVFVIGALIGSLFSGITSAFNKWKETGSLYDALVAGIGGVVNFLTFGLFGEEEVKKLFDSITSFFEPLIEGIKGIYYTVKDWIVNNVGIPKIKFTVLGKDIEFGPYYPFKKNPRSEEPETTQAAPKTKEDVGDTTKVKDLEKSKSEAPRNTESTAPTKDTSKEQPFGFITPTGEEIKLPSGLMFDENAGGLSYKGVSFNAENQKELNNIVKAIDNKSIVEFDGVDSTGKKVRKLFDGTTGKISLLPPKPTSVPAQSAPVAPSSGGNMSASSPSGEAQSAQSAAPSADVSASPSSTGSELSDTSAQVAEAQRMESAADMGSSINASTTTNNSGSIGQSPAKIADVYDSEFAKLYAMA